MRSLILASAAWFVLSLTGCLFSRDPDAETPPFIDVWYGDTQSFGHLGGHPQRWVNILGSVSPADKVRSLAYSLNGGPMRLLKFVQDKQRLAQPGDFNVEILRQGLKPGSNAVRIQAKSKHGMVTEKLVTLEYGEESGRWPLPYEIDWSKVSQISQAVQIVDGKWSLTAKGVRSIAQHYDRILAFGDESWSNYEVSTTVTFHNFTPPKMGLNGTNVIHVAIATRWPGHDPDGKQPTLKWHPLGATAEFSSGHDLQAWHWRIFDGKKGLGVQSERGRAIELEKTYHMKHRVETLPDGRSHYLVKLWPVETPEPDSWDLERFESDDLQSGSALLIAHFTDVTFGNVRVEPAGGSWQ